MGWWRAAISARSASRRRRSSATATSTRASWCCGPTCSSATLPASPSRARTKRSSAACSNLATNQPLHAKLWRFGIIPYLSPSGAGVFKRPVLRLIWAVTQRNDDARSLYASDDPFARRKVEQFFGIGAEWWFNSSSYGQ